MSSKSGKTVQKNAAPGQWLLDLIQGGMPTSSKPEGESQSEVTRGRRWEEQGWGGEAGIRQAKCHITRQIQLIRMYCVFQNYCKSGFLGLGTQLDGAVFSLQA